MINSDRLIHTLKSGPHKLRGKNTRGPIFGAIGTGAAVGKGDVYKFVVTHLSNVSTGFLNQNTDRDKEDIHGIILQKWLKWV